MRAQTGLDTIHQDVTAGRYLSWAKGALGVLYEREFYPLTVAIELWKWLQRANAFLAEQASRICRACAEADWHCCHEGSSLARWTWIDVLLMVATKAIIPEPPRLPGMCPWLGEGGCVLPRLARPMLCATYFCYDLTEKFTAFERLLLDGIGHAVEAVRAILFEAIMRNGLWPKNSGHSPLDYLDAPETLVVQ